MKPLVTVGLPVYNGESFLSEAIRSVLGQSFSDLELVISDNASTDGTEDICRQFVRQDARVRYHRQPQNQGVVVNSNFVFQVSRGTYFRWASHDDFTAPDHLAQCVQALEQHPDAVIAFTQTVLLEGNQRTLHRERLDLQSDDPVDRFWTALIRMGKCNLPYGLLRSSVLRKTNLFGHYIASDIDLMLELAFYGKFVEIESPLFFRRVHPGAASQQDPASLWQHYFPGKGKMLRWNCRKYVERSRAIWRAPLTPLQKRRALTIVLRNFLWEQKDFWLRRTGGPVAHHPSSANSNSDPLLPPLRAPDSLADQASAIPVETVPVDIVANRRDWNANFSAIDKQESMVR